MGSTNKEPCVVSSYCPYCGRLTMDKEYYEIGGNAATHPVMCEECKDKKILCECGCGEYINKFDKGHGFKERRYKQGHSLKKGEEHYRWKGEGVGYISLHQWVKRHLPASILCQNCNKVPPLDLANTTGIYTRDLNNWMYLCRRCHIHSDGRLKNLIPGNSTRIDMSGRVCSVCGSDKTWTSSRDDRPHWFYIDGKLACGNCYRKYKKRN